MKKIFTLIFIFYTIASFGQKLPKEMRLSVDKTRLTLGGNETKGFYNEINMPIIELTFPFDNFIQKLENTNQDIMGDMDIAIYDVYGRLVLSKSEPTNRTSLSVENLAGGSIL